MITIVGSGPSGLTMAYYLTKAGHNVKVIEQSYLIGGCHKVERDHGYFSEHGPRIYLDNYLHTIKMLKELGINFYDYFVPYKFNVSSIGGKSIKHFTIFEFGVLGYTYMTGVNRILTVAEFGEFWNFSSEAMDYMDRLCRLTDGAGIDRYTMYEFLQLINQNALYTVYQPNMPTDKGIFKIWKHKLEQLGVTFIFNSTVNKLNIVKNRIVSLETTQTDSPIITDMCILAIPPRNIYSLLKGNKNKDILNMSIGQFNNWSKNTDYIKYLSITFHWKKKLMLPNIHGFPKTDWGLAYIVLSDYMDMSNEPSKTLISIALTRTKVKSLFTKKTSDETVNRKELNAEILRQLKNSFPDIPHPDKIIIHDSHHDTTKKDNAHTSAFMLTKHGYLSPKTKIRNLYNVGTHNGNSSYAFTSMESAVQNAIVLSNKLLNKNIQSYTAYTLNYIIMMIMVTFVTISVVFLWWNPLSTWLGYVIPRITEYLSF